MRNDRNVCKSKDFEGAPWCPETLARYKVRRDGTLKVMAARYARVRIFRAPLAVPKRPQGMKFRRDGILEVMATGTLHVFVWPA